MSLSLTRRATNLALPISLAAMDACWIFAFTWMMQHLFLHGVSLYAVPQPLVLALLWLAGWWVAGLVINSNLNIRVAQVITMLIGLFVTLGLLVVLYPPGTGSPNYPWFTQAALAAIVGVGTWSLGSYRTMDTLDFNIAFRTFIVGLGAMAFAFFLASLLSAEDYTGFRASIYLPGVSSIPMWFVSASLVAMALGNRELVRRETGSTQARFWVPVLVGCVLFVLLLSVLGGALNFQSILDFAGGVVSWTLFGVAFLIYAALYLIFSIFNTDIPYFRRSPPPPTDEPTQSLPDPARELRRQFSEVDTGPPPVDLQNIFTLVALLLVAIVVLAVLFMVGRRLRRTRQDRVKNLQEERESFGSWALLKRQVAQWWRALLARLFPKRQTAQPASVPDDLAALRGNPEWSGTLSVRQIYARLQAAAARLGYPRAPQQTPLEYLDVLSRAMPHLRADFASITSAYIEARYSPLPATAPAVAAATSAWKHAERQMAPSGTLYRGSGAQKP